MWHPCRRFQSRLPGDAGRSPSPPRWCDGSVVLESPIRRRGHPFLSGLSVYFSASSSPDTSPFLERPCSAPKELLTPECWCCFADPTSQSEAVGLAGTTRGWSSLPAVEAFPSRPVHRIAPRRIV